MFANRSGSFVLETLVKNSPAPRNPVLDQKIIASLSPQSAPKNESR